ncbi:hypothetical protein PUNSTDRAFT_141894 [Punctularia strigosozonata HHB-11173 SS5]|uniref:uncharacterized protein n=1 Tax=Punctularia strigosozonata (strain HHB-11173) TaxID=741275 RepID=UPI0004417B9F|nr:uncharacterized protein PUNSTDRAFT_141894 [Punctularia strigosozonata HHB-11173 SS5]EIN11567.1 hypothetical protein PUNSTDRAFT_141894 [Punctularia strigosozonata HHB-11173 SS5]
MSKHLRPSDAEALPPPKRLHNALKHVSRPATTFDGSLYDELVLHIFTFLPAQSLCRIQPTSRNWCRLAADNQLWKGLFLHEYGRPRLRGARGFISAGHIHEGRPTRPLPARAKGKEASHHDHERDWKWMFRISSNWQTGRCSVEQLQPHPIRLSLPCRGESAERGSHVLLAGTLIITAPASPSSHPSLALLAPSGTRHTLHCPPSTPPCRITALALDQSRPSSASHPLSRLAVFLSTGAFYIFTIDHASLHLSTLLTSHVPSTHTLTPRVIQTAAYHHPLLVTLSTAYSASFSVSLYSISSSVPSRPKYIQTLSSFTSFAPASLVLSKPSSGAGAGGYKLVIAYSVPVYPRHWSVGATELLISPSSSSSVRETLGTEHSAEFIEEEEFSVTSTRSARAFDVPAGFLDASKVRAMREQWGRKVAAVADVQTDGKWVVLGPSPSTPASSPSSTGRSRSPSPASTSASSASTFSDQLAIHSSTPLQLYRLSSPSSSSSPPKLVFTRTLHGATGPLSSLALADGRCVALGATGGVWVWDLDKYRAETRPRLSQRNEDAEQDDEQRVFGVEVAEPDLAAKLSDDAVQTSVAFDERRIVSADARGTVAVRRFDV